MSDDVGAKFRLLTGIRNRDLLKDVFKQPTPGSRNSCLLGWILAAAVGPGFIRISPSWLTIAD